jgi:hypothetical protein
LPPIAFNSDNPSGRAAGAEMTIGELKANSTLYSAL